MLASFFDSMNLYWLRLSAFMQKFWAQMTPEKYGALLIIIAALGFIMMKNGDKKVSS